MSAVLDALEVIGGCVLFALFMCGGIIVSVLLNGPGCPCEQCRWYRKHEAQRTRPSSSEGGER